MSATRTPALSPAESQAAHLALGSLGRPVGARRKPPTRPCACGCETATARLFAPGHDARLVSQLGDAAARGELTAEQATADATARGASPALLAKLAASVARKVADATERQERKAAREAEKAEKAATPEAKAAAFAEANGPATPASPATVGKRSRRSRKAA